jgi:hypothetical protein
MEHSRGLRRAVTWSVRNCGGLLLVTIGVSTRQLVRTGAHVSDQHNDGAAHYVLEFVVLNGCIETVIGYIFGDVGVTSEVLQLIVVPSNLLPRGLPVVTFLSQGGGRVG